MPVTSLESESPAQHTTARARVLVVDDDQRMDDYLVKPFSPGELAARVRSVLRRVSAAPGHQRLTAGPLCVDLATREVTCHGAPVEVTAREFDLLAFLATHPRQVFSRGQLLHRVWKSSPEWLGKATVTEHIHRLRAKIEEDPAHPRLLVTRRGVGYQLDVQP